MTKIWIDCLLVYIFSIVFIELWFDWFDISGAFPFIWAILTYNLCRNVSRRIKKMNERL